jgi:hypothetical protein
MKISDKKKWDFLWAGLLFLIVVLSVFLGLRHGFRTGEFISDGAFLSLALWLATRRLWRFSIWFRAVAYLLLFLYILANDSEPGWLHLMGLVLVGGSFLSDVYSGIRKPMAGHIKPTVAG